MRVLIVGLGSMGRKRMLCLNEQGHEVYGCDVRQDRRDDALAQYGVTAWSGFDEAVERARPEAVMICNEPHEHLPYMKYCIEHGIHSFMEDCCTEDMALYDEVIALAGRHPELVAAPTCCMRFHPSIACIKREVEAGALGGRERSFVTYHCGSYLPDWHTYENVTDYYVCSRSRGGGRDMVPFEFHWLEWILGRVVRVTAAVRKLGTFEADIFDTYQITAEFEGGNTANVTVDVLTRWSSRYFRMVSERGEINWDANERFVNVHEAAGNTWRRLPEAPISGPSRGWVLMDMYRDEVRHFINAARGNERYCCTLDEDKRLNMIVLAAERSAREGVAVDIGP